VERRRLDLRWFSIFMIPDEFKNWNVIDFASEPHKLSDVTAPWKAALDELVVNPEALLPTS
jgi:hypothetical protein